ncbi:MAG: ABC transporter ATP-binding protein [Clostridia bacterium]|nr:ABC transporter ATP-binding protein [Clostridia bacterium]
MKKYLAYFKPFIWMMCFGFTVKALGAITELFLPWILSKIVDDIIPTKSIKTTLLWGGMMLLFSALTVIFNITANRIASKVSAKTTQALRHDLFKKISYLDAAQIDEISISSLESRMTVDSYNVHHMANMSQRLGVRAPFLLIGGIIMSFLLDWRLTLVMVGTLPLIALTITVISKKGIPLFTALQKSIDDMTAVVRENASGVRIIKALRKSEYEKKRFDTVNAEAIRREKKAGITMAFTNPIVTLFLNLGLTAVIIIGAVLVNKGISSTGKIIAFMSYFTIISNALISISRIFTAISKGTAGVKRINAVLEREPTLWTDETTDDDTIESNGCHISFENVSFSYEKNAHTKTIDSLSFKLEHGKTLGIIGPTGSGKSTVISLLLRIYDADEGKIEINGKDIKTLPTKKIRESVGVVFQNDFIFADTIRENISFGRNLSDEQIAKAIEYSQAEDYVANLEEKEEYQLDIKGANLSGGQRQRLLVARALAADPDLLILDDSSSALDYKTDSKLRNAINSHFSRTTKIIIAQRVSSIMNSDLILVLDQGKTVGLGKHEELIDTCPEYAEIYNLQIGGGDID